ncbi:hypothetical protein GQR58_000527 [Nymphon striatum]|nr:hypothetical protein GQR58_000527 [Nymphon striatum]
MSDPVTNVEIEDVLSSIRRLVSEESKPRTDSAPAQPDRLVLTPAQRISETDQETPSLDDASHNDSAPEASDTAELSNDADAQHDDDGGAIDLSAFIDAASVVPAQGNVQSDAEEDRDDSEDTPDRGEEAAEHLTLVEDAVEVEEDNSDEAETVSELEDQSDDASDNSETLEFEDHQDAEEVEAQEDEPLAETVSEDEDAVEEDDEPQVSLEDKIAELEAMVGETQDDWDGDEDIDDADVTSIEWRDTVEDAMSATESERSSASVIHDVEPEETS